MKRDPELPGFDITRAYEIAALIREFRERITEQRKLGRGSAILANLFAAEDRLKGAANALAQLDRS